MAHGQTKSADALRQVLPTTVPAMNFVARFASRQLAGLIVVWQMCYPVQHMLDAAASMASGATLRGILLRAVSGCCYNNGGLRNRRWANAITKHGSKGEWQTSAQSLPISPRRRWARAVSAHHTGGARTGTALIVHRYRNKRA